jgi:hypothetical protein
VLERRFFVALATAVLALAAPAAATPLAIDGWPGAEWDGATMYRVYYNAAAPSGNNGAPGAFTNQIAYDVYTRADSAYIYGLLAINTRYGGTYHPSLAGLVAYFDTDLSGAPDIGIEIPNDRVFLEFSPTTFVFAPSAHGVAWAIDDLRGVIEFAVPFAYLATDPQGLGYPHSPSGVRLEMLRAFGDSFAGGPDYGPDRFGTFVFPSTGGGGTDPGGATTIDEPGGAGMLALLLAFWRLRRRMKGTS